MLDGKSGWLDRVILPLRRKTVLWRLIVLYLAVCVIPILLFGGLYRVRYTSELHRKIGRDSIRLLEMMQQRQNDILENMERIAMKISVADEVQQLLNRTDAEPFDQNRLAMGISRKIEENLLISPMVKNATLLNTQCKVVYSMGYDRISDQVLQQMVQRAEDVYPLEYITSVPYGGDGKASMLMVRAINQSDYTGNRVGYLILAVNEEFFAQQTYRQIYPPEQGQIVLLGDDGTVVSGNDADFSPGRRPENEALLPVIKEQCASGDPHFELTLGSGRYYVSIDYNSKARWYALALVRDSYMNAEMNHLNAFIRILSIACLFLGLLALLAITASIVRPTARLVRYCQDISKQIGPREIRDEGKDEIGYLVQEVSRMVQLLDEHHAKEVQNSIEMKNLEIQMLQAQINPHFLFNTLNSIKWIAVFSRVPAVADSLSALAGLLRNTIIDKSEFIPLEKELDNIKNYALIQSLRYTERFRMQYHVEPDCLTLPILKFLLQPIVENAIIYGVEKTERLVTIQINVRSEKGVLKIAIEDDGSGFDTAALRRAEMDGKRLSGIGIRNVHERIRLVYGEKAEMQVQSSPGNGTCITMLLPELREENKNVQAPDCG